MHPEFVHFVALIAAVAALPVWPTVGQTPSRTPVPPPKDLILQQVRQSSESEKPQPIRNNHSDGPRNGVQKHPQFVTTNGTSNGTYESMNGDRSRTDSLPLLMPLRSSAPKNVNEEMQQIFPRSSALHPKSVTSAPTSSIPRTYYTAVTQSRGTTHYATGSSLLDLDASASVLHGRAEDSPKRAGLFQRKKRDVYPYPPSPKAEKIKKLEEEKLGLQKEKFVLQEENLELQKRLDAVTDERDKLRNASEVSHAESVYSDKELVQQIVHVHSSWSFRDLLLVFAVVLFLVIAFWIRGLMRAVTDALAGLRNEVQARGVQSQTECVPLSRGTDRL